MEERGGGRKQSDALQEENENDTLPKSISPLTRGMTAGLLNIPGGYTTT